MRPAYTAAAGTSFLRTPVPWARIRYRDPVGRSRRYRRGLHSEV